MGRGQRDSAAPQPTAAHRSARRVQRPFQTWDTDRLLQATLVEGDRSRARELERELWRRPGGSGFRHGQEIRGLTVAAIDADRLRVLMSLPDDAGLVSMTQHQLLDLMFDGRVTPPTRPDARPPRTPVDYGQHGKVAAMPHPAHQPVDGQPASVAFAAERQRIDDQRDRMTEIRPDTDIVEFERLYWQQAVAGLALAEQVAAAGGLDAATGGWGSRYVHGMPAQERHREHQLRRTYEHIRDMRDQGHHDKAIIAYLEGVYDSPFGGPRPVGG